jgi:GNAT superfamily N-acetyltransferase
MVKLTSGETPALDEALLLYSAVGDDDGGLLGLARTVSDGESICYVQDILVQPDAQRRGVGRLLVQEILERYRHCMFVALSTDAADVEDALRSHPFYRSMGFVPHPELGLAAFGYRS